jgi:hypothetical protein
VKLQEEGKITGELYVFLVASRWGKEVIVLHRLSTDGSVKQSLKLWCCLHSQLCAVMWKLFQIISASPPFYVSKGCIDIFDTS